MSTQTSTSDRSIDAETSGGFGLKGLLLGFIALVGAFNKRAGAELLKTLKAAEGDIGRPVGHMTEGVARRMKPESACPTAGVGRGQLGLGTILAAFVVVIAGMVVVIVVDRFDQSLGTPSSSDLSTAEADILSGFSDMASLIGPLLLIGIGVVIIGLIRRVQ